MLKVFLKMVEFQTNLIQIQKEKEKEKKEFVKNLYYIPLKIQKQIILKVFYHLLDLIQSLQIPKENTFLMIWMKSNSSM